LFQLNYILFLNETKTKQKQQQQQQKLTKIKLKIKMKQKIVYIFLLFSLFSIGWTKKTSNNIRQCIEFLDTYSPKTLLAVPCPLIRTMEQVKKCPIQSITDVFVGN
jgi:hypothetical protein